MNEQLHDNGFTDRQHSNSANWEVYTRQDGLVAQFEINTDLVTIINPATNRALFTVSGQLLRQSSLDVLRDQLAKHGF